MPGSQPDNGASTDTLLQFMRELEGLCGDRVKQDPLYISLLMKQLSAHSPDKALVTVQAIGFALDPVALRPILIDLGKRFLSDQDYGQLERLIDYANERGIALEPAVLLRFARHCIQAGHLAKAKLLCERARSNDPQSPFPIQELYTYAVRQGDVSEAHSLLNNLVRLTPTAATYAYAFKERAKLVGETGKPVRIALLSSFTIDQLSYYLDVESRLAGLNPAFYVAPFNQYTQDILNPESELYRFDPEIVFLFLALEDLFPEVTACPSCESLEAAAQRIQDQLVHLAEEIRERTSAVVVVAEFVLSHPSPYGILDSRLAQGLRYWMQRLNHQIVAAFQSKDRSYVLPLQDVVSTVGHQLAANPKLYYMASMKIGEGCFAELARYCMRYIKPLKGLTRKCIIVDLDNTLWGGVVGEVGFDGIHLGPTAPGAEYMDFQLALLNLTRKGILLAVCSKNNPDDVLPVLRSHPHMFLKEEHFVAMRINWDNKADNIRSIAEELNIGLDSLVFIDDNPNERELIKQLLPEVLTIDMPQDPSRYRTVLEAMSDFELLALTKEDEMRAAHYQAMGKRQAMRNTARSLEDYLRSLTIQVDISYARKEVLPRLVQLFNKTNQFNLTTRRYQSADLDRFFASKGHRIYVLQARDRFVDHGIVGTALVETTMNRWSIDSLLMSCRVMGLTIEQAFLARIAADALDAGAGMLAGEFISTAKNHPVKDFYAKQGFSLTQETAGHQFYELEIREGTIHTPEWIATTGVTHRHAG